MEQATSVLIPLVGWTAVTGVALAFMVMRFWEAPYVESRCVVLLATVTGAMYVAMAAALTHAWLGITFPILAINPVYYSAGLLIGLLIIVLIIAILAIYYAQSLKKIKKAAGKASGNAAKAAAEADPTGTLEEFLKKAKSGDLKEKDIIEAVKKFDPDGKGDPDKLWKWLKDNDLSTISCQLGKALLPELEKMKTTGKAGGQQLSKEDLDEVQKMIDFIKKNCPDPKPEEAGDDH
jgi:hypothetical protein